MAEGFFKPYVLLMGHLGKRDCPSVPLGKGDVPPSHLSDAIGKNRLYNFRYNRKKCLTRQKFPCYLEKCYIMATYA